MLKISFAKPRAVKTGALVVMAQDGGRLTPSAREMDKALGGTLSRALKTSRFNSAPGEFLEVLAPDGKSAPGRVVIAGLGKPAQATPQTMERIGGLLAARLLKSGETQVSVLMDPISSRRLSDADAAAHLALGARLRAYQFTKYRTTLKPEQKASLNSLTMLCDAAAAAKKAWAPLEAAAQGVYFTRDLVNEPANVLYPVEFAGRVRELTEIGVKVKVLGEKDMTKLGMGALLGVGQGSQHESQLVVMEWSGGKAGDKPIAFVGKGVCFDTGGISLKPPQGMWDMKWDMGGAGVVSGVMKTLALRKAKANVVGILGLVENMPSGTAQRPGDVVTSMSGQTIEVLNTDAEGRLVLADALTYVQQKFSPRMIIDLATLTGAIMMSLGQEYGGLFASDEKLAGEIEAAGKATGDEVWRMPMGDVFDKMINSPIADMKNIGGRFAGSITAAQFLKRFVEDVPWAHLDIAGAVWREDARATHDKGATGYGVRLLDRLVADYYED